MWHFTGDQTGDHFVSLGGPISNAELEERGYKAVVARGRQACLDVLKEYFAEDNLDLVK